MVMVCVCVCVAIHISSGWAAGLVGLESSWMYLLLFSFWKRKRKVSEFAGSVMSKARGRTWDGDGF